MNHSSSPTPPPSPRTSWGLRKLPARSAAWVMPLLLSLLMTFIVSLISTVRVVGFSLDLPRLWMSSWALSWLVAFPTLLLVLPVVRRVTAAIVEPQG
ncbi:MULTISPECIES: DUF2798 domain-containing protein [unclassified Acidovorax]|uniref:DUF2798 domain-containing protein n=1 Tax=unclassified Acidovorax TaxID=2684926 RepID=UPI001C4588D8|nr:MULTISPECIES: DUF2798 domain-containing protein [unclassified Acidovorax]MBV7429518.1 DUF2798 domain-containing protein [Acidovorax sp. sif0732]MBV7448596.1 DUF2798 domain-containing protein [Acidovorax sp. sif0715]